MLNNYLLSGNTAQMLYKKYSDLPIFDYHCHLSPKEIYEDKPFNNIGEMFLSADHYKWRLMRCYGVDEKYITGSADWKEKFIKYAECLQTAAGNPLYYWTHMELSIYFGIYEYLCAENAEEIYEKSNNLIHSKSLSPRKLILESGVKYIATTDDVCDDLSWHKKISDEKLSFTVSPSFRTDRILSINRSDYSSIINELESASGIQISSLSDYKSALEQRIFYFVEHGCKFSDVGLPCFPDDIFDDDTSDEIFKKALSGEKITGSEFSGFLGNMYLFLAQKYRDYNLVMQLHLGVLRNTNTALFELCGADCGGDSMGEDITPSQLVRLFDSINSTGGMPDTVVYALKPGLYPVLCNVTSSYRNCICGAAWWFCDNKRGIEEQIQTLCEQGHIGKFLGMLTDSRSFLSYARHDFFRRIFCSKIGAFVDSGEFDIHFAEKLTQSVFCDNISKLIFD